MAKRTPRTEAQDTATAPPAREQRPGPSSERPRPTREGDNTSTEEAAPQSADTFAARAQPDQRHSGAGSSPDTAPDPIGSGPTEEEIRYRAYLLYIERGGEHGTDFEDWLNAERELRSRK